MLGQRIGNIYCGSLFLSLVSLLAHEDIPEVTYMKGKNIVLFAYGSGFASSMFRLQTLAAIPKDPTILQQLSLRTKITPEDYTARMKKREEDYQRKDFIPQDNITELRPGTVYLEKVDSRWRRFYGRVQTSPKL